MKRILISEVLAIAAILSLATVGCTSVRRHPDFKQRRSEIVSIALMPPNVNVMLIKFKEHNERLSNEEQLMRSVLPILTATEFKKHGFNVMQSEFLDEQLARDPNLTSLASILQKACSSAIESMYLWPQMLNCDARKYEMNIGSEVNLLAGHFEVDALVFMFLSGYRKTTGAQIADTATGIVTDGVLSLATGMNVTGSTSRKSVAQLYVVLVDGLTGDVLWASRKDNDFMHFSEECAEAMVVSLFEDFPSIYPQRRRVIFPLRLLAFIESLTGSIICMFKS